MATRSTNRSSRRSRRRWPRPRPRTSGRAVSEAKTAVEGGDTDTIKAKAEALAQVAMKMGQAIYEKDQQAAASPGAEAPGAEAGAGTGDEEVVDAEFSEVDENNKG